MNTLPMTRKPLLAVMLALVFVTALPAQGPPATENQELNIDTYVGLLRQDIQSQKVAITGVMMGLTPDEASAFWPVYSEYQRELGALGDQRVSLIKDYSEHYTEITEQKAAELVNSVLDLESQRTALKRKYFARLSEALSATKAAKFFQIENQLLLMIDLQVASSLPVVQ